jgi:hypothetical protein
MTILIFFDYSLGKVHLGIGGTKDI